jgi:hypothetical protein
MSIVGDTISFIFAKHAFNTIQEKVESLLK